MSKTFAYSISLAVFLTFFQCQVKAQDTSRPKVTSNSQDTSKPKDKSKTQDSLIYPLKIRAGIEVSGPAIYYTNKKVKNLEGFVSYDLDEKRSITFSLGSLNYKYSQYNYSYMNKGTFIRIGMDFNILKPDKAMGKYWGGLGLKYGISRYNSVTPELLKENYWGVTTSSIPERTNWGHFVEVDPGVRAELFKNFSMGWTISLRMLVHAGGSKDLRPIYLPGFGNATKTITAGLGYFLVWNIPFKKITVVPKKEVPDDDEEDDTNTTNGTNGNPSNTRNPGMRQPIRQ